MQTDDKSIVATLEGLRSSVDGFTKGLTQMEEGIHSARYGIREGMTAVRRLAIGILLIGPPAPHSSTHAPAGEDTAEADVPVKVAESGQNGHCDMSPSS